MDYEFGCWLKLRWKIGTSLKQFFIFLCLNAAISLISRFSSKSNLTTRWQRRSSTHRKHPWWSMSGWTRPMKWTLTSMDAQTRLHLRQSWWILCHWVRVLPRHVQGRTHFDVSDVTCILGSTPFANYQPQKASSSAFELGITRTTPSPSSASSEENTFISNTESDGDEYLKPATDEESQRWSSEGTRGTDLLF